MGCSEGWILYHVTFGGVCFGGATITVNYSYHDFNALDLGVVK